ncbi:sugar ABC transporter permease [Aestuariivirga sp.]|uniref:sugar ABC transporter permease n=1 Tax=Aestuariivirga sp. TaxID=2650926 RepID=UPI003593D292
MSKQQTSSESPALTDDGPVRRFLNATEIDTRMIGMIAALLLIWCTFDIASGILRGNFGGLLGGSFLTPRNLWNLLNQTASIAIMTTGMVLIIVMRHIDLSVGSMLSLVAVAGAVIQVYQLAPVLGVGHPAIWIIAIVAILALGTAIGAFNGYLTAYAQIPAFIVTLGGLIAYSGVAFLLAKGETVAPMDKTFKILGGTIPASWIGPFWTWTLSIIACVLIVLAIIHGRRQRIRFKFPLRPIWAEATLAALGSATVLGAAWIVNAYPWPPKLAENYAKENNIAIPPGIEDRAGDAICMAGDKVVRCIEGLTFGTGYAAPVLVALAVGAVMTFIAGRTRFGRYVYASGGNPEAAILAGINTKMLTVKVFALMGFLVGVSAIISSARLDAATNALGGLNELYVIAAAVIGGTSLAGGLGTIYGAILGALMMQSIQSGMGLLNLPAAFQNIVVGSVLVIAVWLDQIYRRNVK